MSNLSKFTPRYRAETADLALSGWQAFSANSAPDWVSAIRTRGQAVVAEQGLPTPKLERFKYFNLPAWLKKNDVTPARLNITLEGDLEHVSTLSDVLHNTPDWLQGALTSVPAGESQYGDMMLWHLSNAFMADGVVIDIPKNYQSEEPTHIVFKGADGQFTTAHSAVNVAENAQIVLIEDQSGQGAYFHNALTQIKIAKNARVRHYRFQENDMHSAIVQNTFVDVAEGATYESFTVTNGAGLSRHQVHLNLTGKTAECHLNGVNLLSGKQQADTTITVEHQAPACISKQNYRNVLNDKATGTFQGKVHVHQIAQQTDGYQKSDSLLLSGEATMNTKPELEIYADDVKCSHGTTAGRMDDDALFYLKSRGIPEKQARALLIEAFAGQALEGITFEPMIEQINQKIHQWLENA